ncbi:hypothetical protein K469DRAFT_367589 [Zopfia rhizophila CBS 207.26]|uniref:Uncharacterized protein n=1 Tax=Zopfia rhizophila CBS 207.26 TaxID=1314779 RepID=A0A6A6EMD8_9PEZI|nr:hypothetical protein K469DRAFT_367589 [Zopfia rhizophila CBS 207.26]
MAPRIGPEPTYYIPPSLDCPPDGVIALGNIFADGLYPEYPLSLQDKNNPHEVTQVPEIPGPIYEDRTRLEGFRIWARVLDIFQGKAGASNREHRYVGHHPSEIVTEVLKNGGPTLQAIRERIASDEALKRYMNIDGYGFAKPVYMIAGRKIAKNVRYSYRHDSHIGGILGGGGQVAEDVSVGAEANTSGESRDGRSGLIKGDIVFAYRLLEIRPQGVWKNKDLSVGVYRKDALLDDDEKAKDAEVDKGVLEIEWSDAAGLADDEAEMFKLDGPAEQCVLVMRKEAD